MKANKKKYLLRPVLRKHEFLTKMFDLWRGRKIKMIIRYSIFSYEFNLIRKFRIKLIFDFESKSNINLKMKKILLKNFNL